MLTGVLLGLAAAFCLSVSYLCLRIFSCKYGRGSLDMLAYSHVTMGLFALIVLALARPTVLPPIRLFIAPMCGGMAFYLASQFFMMRALRYADASWVSPLLGLKIIMLAVITTVFMDRHLGALQWGAAGASVLATFTLGQSRGGFNTRALGWVLLACAGYSVSDLCVKATSDLFVKELGLFRGCLVSASLSYGAAGLVALVFVFARPRAPVRVWLGSVPFAAAWFLAMLFLFACFVSIGVVYGNIVQATRGVISVALGAAVSAFGFVHLEERIGRGMLARRLASAALMVLAIAMFQLGRQ